MTDRAVGHTPDLVVSPEFEYGDLIAIRRARKSHECEMPRDNPIVAVEEGGRTVHRQRYPNRPSRFRSWDGGRVPEEHTPRIAFGDQYVEYFGETPAFQSGKRYCAGCAIAAGIAARATSEVGA